MFTVQSINDPTYTEAVDNLSVFVREMANKAAADQGFAWTATTNAPDTYDKLRIAYRLSRKTGAALPVSSLYCDTVLYKNPADNYAMRFWHDTLHMKTGLTFDLDDELELGLRHLALAEQNGVTRYSLEWRMLRIDILGQNYLLGIAKRFPLNQAEFVRGCLLHGLDEGVLIEARKSVEAA